MKNINPLRTARLTEQRLKKLGWNPGEPLPNCVDCGETDLACLVKEHPVGRDRDPNLWEIVCLNCHYKRERKRDRAGLTTNGQHRKETPHESHYRYLMLQAENLRNTAASLEREAEKVRNLEELDQ